MLPSVAQAKLLIEKQRSGPAGSPNGGYPPTLQPRVTRSLGATVGSVFGLERLDIVRHSVTPAHVKTRRVHNSCSLWVHQGELNPPFPAVQGTPIKIPSYRAEIFSIQVPLERQAIFALFLSRHPGFLPRQSYFLTPAFAKTKRAAPLRQFAKMTHFRCTFYTILR